MRLQKRIHLLTLSSWRALGGREGEDAVGVELVEIPKCRPQEGFPSLVTDLNSLLPIREAEIG